jgi:hypothetical protein
MTWGKTKNDWKLLWLGAVCAKFLADLLILGSVETVFLPNKGEIVLHGKAFQGDFL